MTAEPETTRDGVRASNAEREAFAATISTASADGRITVTEADERLTHIYAATFREELPGIVADLPKETWPVDYGRPDEPQPEKRRRGNEWSAGLTVHAAFVALIAITAIVGWVHSGAPFFWPAFPMFWLGMSVFVHYRIRQRWLHGARNYRGRWSSHRAA